MKFIKHQLLASSAIFATFATGCSSLTPPAQIRAIEGQSPQWINYSSDRRGAFVYTYSKKDQNGNPITAINLCSEPAPDTSNNFESQVALAKKDIAELNGQIGQNVVILPGRDKTVLTLRESLYRLCELSINRPDIEAKELMAAYNKVITAVTQYAEAETAKANADVAKAQVLTSSTPSQPTTNAVTAAIDAERSGFQNIIDGKYKEAEADFTRAESLSPGIHNAYEIKSALRSALQDGSVSEDEKKQIVGNIIKNWSWGLPKDLAEKLKAINAK